MVLPLRTARWFVPLFCAVTAVGCNALLGTEDGEATAGSATDGGADSDTRPGENESKADASGAPDSGIPPRGDSKPPCDPCDLEKVVDTAGEPKNLQVRGKHIYFSDYTGSYRVARAKPPCTKADCKEVITANGGSSVAASDTHVCWVTAVHFGCASVDDLSIANQVEAKPLGVIPRRMVFAGDTLYAMQGDKYQSLPMAVMRGPAAEIAAGTGSFGNVSGTPADIHAFALSATHVAWSEGDYNANVVKTRSLAGGSVNPIPLPSTFDTTYQFIDDVAVYESNVLVSPYNGRHIYRAPLDGSAEAKPLFAVSRSRLLVAHSSGIYVTRGDPSNGGGVYGLDWSSHNPGAGTKTTALVSTNGKVTGLAIGDDGIYYGEHVASGQSAIWRLPFTKP